MDTEKVNKGLERCLSGKMPFGCGKCPYYGDEEYNDAWSCRLSLMRDARELLKAQRETIDELISADKALKLLKEQEAVKPEVEVLNEIDRLYRCQRCHKHFFYEKQKYCDQCGQAVKWE